MKSFIPDYHVHSEFSSDCKSDVMEIIKSAKNKGIYSICLTDHNDYDFPDVPDHMKFDLEIDRYLDYLTKLKQELAPEFDLRIGVEQGLMPTTCETMNSFSTEHPGIDFIICSSHVVNFMDPYYPQVFTNPDGSKMDDAGILGVYRQYFEDILYNVTHFNDFNVYGHLDYILRYGPLKVNAAEYGDVIFSRFSDIFEEILKNLIANGKGIEINTGSLYRGMDYSHPHTLVFKLYKELGGEILTFGSDSHDYDHIGHSFENAREYAKENGFKYYTTFKDMKPTFINL